MRIKYSYKSYKESKVATSISFIGGIFNASGKGVLLILLIQLLKVTLGSGKYEKSNLNSVIIFCGVMSGVLFAMGILFNFIAKNIAVKEFKRRLALSYEEVGELIDKKPNLKQWFMENHPRYSEAHKNEISYVSNDECDKGKIENLDIKKSKKGKLVSCLFCIILIATSIFLVINNRDEGSSNVDSKHSPLNDAKYQCYIHLNNDIVQCYELSIDLYLKDKGMDEKIKHSREENKVQITPILDDKYKNLQKARQAVNEKPKMDIDQDIIKLADATEKIYDLIGEIYYCYGGQEYGKKTDKTKEQLHKEFLINVLEYDGLYKNFSIQLDKMSLTYMAKNLETYKKNNDMDSYYILNTMIKAEKVYEYFVENNITNENLFAMNLEEYNKLLEEFNKDFADFEKQNIKGPTVHTTSFCDFMKAYHSFVNNIVNMVKEKNFYEGKLDAPKGLVSPNEKDDIQERLYFYIDRMISAYNSIQSFKK